MNLIKNIVLILLCFLNFNLFGQITIDATGHLVNGVFNSTMPSVLTTDSLPRMDAIGNPKGSPINNWVTPRIAVLDATGNLSTGTTVHGIYTIKNTSNVYPSPQSGTMLHIVSDNIVNGRISSDTYNDVSQVGSIFQGRRARGTSITPTGALQDDIIAVLGGDAYGLTDYHNISLGSIALRAKQNITDTNGGTYWSLSTTPNNSITNTERVRIDDSGVRNRGKSFIETISVGLSTDSLLVTKDGETKKIAPNIEQAIFVSANTANSSNATYTNLGTINAVAGQKYKIIINGTYQTVATTTGLRLRLNGTAVVSGGGYLKGSITNAAAATALSVTVNNVSTATQLLTTGVAVINTPHDFSGMVTFLCTTSGTINFEFASEINASACTINAGSALFYTIF